MSDYTCSCNWCDETVVIRELSNGKWECTEPNGLYHMCNRKRYRN
jgi:hypothetical protein